MNGDDPPIPNLFTFLRWADVYGEESSLPEVLVGLAEFDRELLSQNLLKFNFLITGRDEAIDVALQRRILESSIGAEPRNAIREALQQGASADVILNAHQLLYSLKVSLRSGPDANGRGLSTLEDRQRVVELLLQVNDHINPLHDEGEEADDVDIKLALLTTMLPISALYNPPNLYEATARLSRMLGEIDEDLAAARPDERVDISALFEDLAGISVDAYMAFTFSLVAYFRTLSNEQVSADLGVTIIDPDVFVTHMQADAGVLRDYLGLISQSLDGFRESLSEDLGIPDLLDLVLFRDYPIIEFPDDRYRCIHLPFLQDKVTQGVFWLPHRQEEFDFTRFRGWWGQLFEEYVHRLIHEFYPPASRRYLPNPTPHEREELVDGIIDYGHSLVFLEFKSSLLSMRARHPEAPQVLENALRENLGVEQLANAVSRFLDNTGDCEVDGIERESVTTIYPVLVCLDHVMGTYLLGAVAGDFFRRALALPEDGPQVKPLTVITIEELEHLLPYVEERSIVELLELWYGADPSAITSFDFVMHQRVYGEDPRENPWVVRAADDWAERTRGYLFPSETRDT